MQCGFESENIIGMIRHKLSARLGTIILSSESLLMLRISEIILPESWGPYKSRKEIDLSLTDCTSAILARKQGMVDIYSFDRDFEAFRLPSCQQTLVDSLQVRL